MAKFVPSVTGQLGDIEKYTQFLNCLILLNFRKKKVFSFPSLFSILLRIFRSYYDSYLWSGFFLGQVLAKNVTVGNGTSATGHAKWGVTMGEIFILEKNVWNKSCFFLWDLQNELSYVKIGLQIKKFLFFGHSHFSRLFLHKRAKHPRGWKIDFREKCLR